MQILYKQKFIWHLQVSFYFWSRYYPFMNISRCQIAFARTPLTLTTRWLILAIKISICEWHKALFNYKRKQQLYRSCMSLARR